MHYKVHSKEKFYFALKVLTSLILYAVLIGHSAIFNPFFAAGIVIQWIFIGTIFFAIKKCGEMIFIGYLKGNAIKVTEKQLPEIAALLKSHAEKLELSKVPTMYVLQGNGILNAFATRLLKKNYIVIHSDILELAYQEGIDAVSFVIGHELGHITRKHLTKGSILTIPAYFIPFLHNAYSRACEYTCDNIGYYLCPQGALNGILVLACGKKLYKKINYKELLLTFEWDNSFSVAAAEIFSTHPALLKRVANINELQKENFTSDKPLFVSPYIDIKPAETHNHPTI